MVRRNVNREAKSVEFTHIILTRFNVVTSFAPSTRGLEKKDGEETGSPYS